MQRQPRFGDEKLEQGFKKISQGMVVEVACHKANVKASVWVFRVGVSGPTCTERAFEVRPKRNVFCKQLLWLNPNVQALQVQQVRVKRCHVRRKF